MYIPPPTIFPFLSFSFFLSILSNHMGSCEFSLIRAAVPNARHPPTSARESDVREGSRPLYAVSPLLRSPRQLLLAASRGLQRSPRRPPLASPCCSPPPASAWPVQIGPWARAWPCLARTEDLAWCTCSWPRTWGEETARTPWPTRAEVAAPAPADLAGGLEAAARAPRAAWRRDPLVFDFFL